jgi:dephospho-CoA kinase
VPVYEADRVVHRLYEGEAAAPIEAAFAGASVDGRVDRERLSRAVLDDPAAFARLEGIVHPLVRAAQQRFLAAARTSGASVVALDIPLLFETGGERRVDAVVVASAPADVQRARDEEKRRRAHFVVDTARGFDSAAAQVRGILRAVAAIPGRSVRPSPAREEG